MADPLSNVLMLMNTSRQAAEIGRAIKSTGVLNPEKTPEDQSLVNIFQTLFPGTGAERRVTGSPVQPPKTLNDWRESQAKAPAASLTNSENATPNYIDRNGFGPGMGNRDQIWGNRQFNDNGYNRVGDGISDKVKPPVFDKSNNTVFKTDEEWKEANYFTSRLFADGKQLNEAFKYTESKLESKYKELDVWGKSFLTANQISKEAANGKVGDMLLSDQKWLDGLQNSEFGKLLANNRNGNLSAAGVLNNKYNDYNHSRLEELVKEEGKISMQRVEENLRGLGFNTNERYAYNLNGRALLETAKNVDFLKSFDQKISEAKENNTGAKIKFDLKIDLVTDANGDTSAFGSANRGMEFAQMSKLKDGGLSSDPKHGNQLYFAVAGVKDLRELVGQLKEKFGANADAILGNVEFSINGHGGQDGSTLIGDNSGQKGVTKTDDSSFDPSNPAHAKILEDLGKLTAKNGGSELNIYGNSCHSGNQTDKYKDDVYKGVKEGAGSDKANKAGVHVRYTDNGENVGLSNPFDTKAKDGYLAFNFNASGATGLQTRYSNLDGVKVDGGLTKTRLDEQYISRNTGSMTDARSKESQTSYYDKLFGKVAESEQDNKKIAVNADNFKDKEKDPTAVGA